MISTVATLFTSYGAKGIIVLLLIGYISKWFIMNKIYYIPNINGIWEMELLYQKSKYKPYKNMTVKYKLFIVQTNNSLDIKGEKLYEKLNNGQCKTYKGDEIRSSKYNGNIKRGFMNHSINLVMEEHGQIRDVSGSLNLQVISPINLIQGTFNKTDANSSGKVKIYRVYE